MFQKNKQLGAERNSVKLHTEMVVLVAVRQQCTTMLPHMIYLLPGWITVIRYYLKSLQLIQKAVLRVLTGTRKGAHPSHTGFLLNSVLNLKS